MYCTLFSEKKPRNRGPSFKLSGVQVKAKPTMQALEEMEIVYKSLPSNKLERKAWNLECHVRNSHFDCLWTTTDDSSLLKGIYEYGMGNWELMKMDSELNLHDKILPDGVLKPQAKHLQTRAEFLIKLLQKQIGGTASKAKVNCYSNV